MWGDEMTCDVVTGGRRRGATRTCPGEGRGGEEGSDPVGVHRPGHVRGEAPAWEGLKHMQCEVPLDTRVWLASNKGSDGMVSSTSEFTGGGLAY